MKSRVLLLAIALSISLPAYAQEAAPSRSPPETRSAEEKSDAPTSVSASAPAFATDRDLTLETIPLDIDTASYYELLAWSERLDLSTRGSKTDLQNRLRTHYGISATAEVPETDGESRPIFIESANSTTSPVVSQIM